MNSFAKINKKLLPVRNLIGTHLIELQQVDSTNNYATALVHAAMAQHGTVVWALHQTAGKAQRQKSWSSASGENITASFILSTEKLLPSDTFLLSKTMAVAVQKFFKKQAGGETKIKWPNDVYWRDRKTAGILIENIVRGKEWKYAVVGIGININQTLFPALGNKAASLKQITGKTYDLLPLLKELCNELENALRQMEEAPSIIETTYHSELYKKDEIVKLRKANRLFEVKIKGVDATGRLIAHHLVDEFFEVGEVEWITD